MSTPLQTTPPPGWYHDPQTPSMTRYFDGTTWTEHVAPLGTPTSAGAPGTSSASGAPPWSPQPARLGASPSDPVHWLLPTGRTWQSIAAGYVALFAIVVWFLGPIALGLGVWALKASQQGGAHGRSRAIFAIVVGALTTFATIAVVIAAA